VTSCVRYSPWRRLITFYRTQSLESQLSESDAEAQRLRVAFEELRKSTSESISDIQKKLSEAEKDSGARVGVFGLLDTYIAIESDSPSTFSVGY
jgi:hypothetical protein